MPNHLKTGLESSGDVENNVSRQPWDRIPGESTQAYAAFAFYRDLGSERSLAKVGQEVGKNLTLIERWSASWNWVGRVYEFDCVEDERSREQLCRDRTAMRRRHIRLGMAMQAVATHGLRELQIKIEQGLPLNLSVSEIVNLMECGAQLENDALGDEKDHRYTRIIVNLGTHQYDDEPLEAEDDRQPN
jgi:hypothetical protein